MNVSSPQIGLATVLAALLSLSTGATAVGCSGSRSSSGASTEPVGTAAIAITDAPADGTCIQVTAAGYRTVTRTFAVPAGESSVFTLDGLPLGQVTFTAEAFGGTCPPSDDSGVTPVPNWISVAPFTTEISVQPPALVTLTLVRNGNADVAVNFDDEAGASPDGSTAADGGAVSGGANRAYMQVPGTTGGETLAPFAGWFDIAELDVSAIVPVTVGATGAGSGVGKATWSLGVSLPAQLGSAALYSFASMGKVFPTVTFDYVAPGMTTPFYSVVLTNATLSSVKSSSANATSREEISLTFVFTRIQLTFASAATTSTASFDLATDTSSGAPNTAPWQFAVGASAPTGFEQASSFTAPSETRTTSAGVGAGAGAGATSFSPASITLPLDGSVLGDLDDAVTGRHLASGSVELFTTGSTMPYGTYGFTDVLLESVSITGTVASVSFEAANDTWTFNAVP